MVMIRSDEMVMRGNERELEGMRGGFERDERDFINLFIQSIYDTILEPGDLSE